MSQSEIAVEKIDEHHIGVALPTELTIGNSSALYETLAGIVETTSVVVLIASSVDKIDTAGLQLITAFTHERSDQALLTELRHRTDRLTEALSRLGLTEFFA